MNLERNRMKLSAEASSESRMGSVVPSGIARLARSSVAPLALNTIARAVPEGAVAVPVPPADWISFDDFNLTPVLDDVSRHLHLACNAFDDRDDKSTICELRAVAAELRRGAIKAGRRAGAAACVDVKFARVVAWRLASGAAKVSMVAQAIGNGTVRGKVGLTALIDGSVCADIERRWLVTDEDIWYPVCGEPQRHFVGAMRAYERQDNKTTVTEMQKATGYLRLEAGRATDYAKRALDGAVAGLGKLALCIVLARMTGRKSVEDQFAVADLALALAHRAKSSEWWARGDNRISGYELKAAAGCLEDASAWVGNGIGPSASKAARDAKAMAERLIRGDGPERDEAAQGFVSFGSAVEALGRKINTH
jgi:hypothetical protein